MCKFNIVSIFFQLSPQTGNQCIKGKILPIQTSQVIMIVYTVDWTRMLELY